MVTSIKNLRIRDSARHIHLSRGRIHWHIDLISSLVFTLLSTLTGPTCYRRVNVISMCTRACKLKWAMLHLTRPAYEMNDRRRSNLQRWILVEHQRSQSARQTMFIL